MVKSQRVFYIAPYMIVEIWTPIEVRQGEEIKDQRSKNGRYEISIGIPENKNNMTTAQFAIRFATGTAYDISTARKNVFQAYKECTHGRYTTKKNLSLISQYANGMFEPIKI